MPKRGPKGKSQTTHHGKGSWTKDTDYGAYRAQKLFSLADSKSVSVGWHQGGKHPSGLTNAALGAIHEYGSPSRNIPARPTIGITTNSNMHRYRQLLNKAWKKMIESRGSGNAERDIDAALMRFGQTVVNDMKRQMTSQKFGTYVPLALSTLKRKGKKTKPLINTGALRNAIEAKVTATGTPNTKSVSLFRRLFNL